MRRIIGVDPGRNLGLSLVVENDNGEIRSPWHMQIKDVPKRSFDHHLFNLSVQMEHEIQVMCKALGEGVIIEALAMEDGYVDQKKSNFIDGYSLLHTYYESKAPIISKGIMPAGSHIIISGESGVGKSLFRSELAIHLALGMHWLGFPINEKHRVAIFQYENPCSLSCFIL